MAGKLTDELTIKIIADFHTGMSQGKLADKYQLSKATINKICKGMRPKNISRVEQLVRIKTELMEQDIYSAKAVEREVDRKLKDLEFFRESSMTVTRRAMDLVVDSEQISMFDLEKAQSIIGKGKENIYGKSPETAVQINNSTAAPAPTDLSHLTLAEKLEIKRKVFNTP